MQRATRPQPYFFMDIFVFTFKKKQEFSRWDADASFSFLAFYFVHVPR